MKDWRAAGQDTVVAEIRHKDLAGFNKTGIAQENSEAIVVLKNGLIDEICTAGSISTLSTWEGIKRWAGMGPNVQVFYLDITPRTLEYWLEDPAKPRDNDSGQLFGLPALTSDGELISAQVNLTVAIDMERPDLLLRALHGRTLFTMDDLRALVRDELLGKVIGPALSKRTAKELRGNSELLEEFYKDVKIQLSNTLVGYGLKLDTSQFYINWGLTQSEVDEIDKRRREREIKQAEHEQIIENIRSKGEKDEGDIVGSDNRPGSGIKVGRDLIYTKNEGIGGLWITLIVATILACVLALGWLLRG